MIISHPNYLLRYVHLIFEGCIDVSLTMYDNPSSFAFNFVTIKLNWHIKVMAGGHFMVMAGGQCMLFNNIFKF